MPMTIPAPSDFSESAGAWLAEQGYVPRVPVLRSSMLSDLYRCRFLFYLRHRLGLVPFYEYVCPKESYLIGTFAHYRMEAELRDLDDDGVREFMTSVHSQELLEARQRNVDLDNFLDAETIEQSYSDALTLGWCFAEAALSLVPLPLEHDGGKLRVVMIEPFIRFARGTFPGVTTCPVAIKPDAVLYREDRNEVWLPDYKTSGFSPYVRMASAPFDFQAHLYKKGVQELITRGKLEPMGVPRSAKVAGFIHYVLQKPTIRVSKRTIAKHGLAEAQSEYRARCRDWYAGEGEFSHLKIDRTPETQPVNLSYLRGGADPRDFWAHLDELVSACTHLNAAPEHYPRHPEGMTTWMGDRLTSYAPLYTMPVHDWPAYLKSNFVVSHRDDDKEADLELE